MTLPNLPTRSATQPGSGQNSSKDNEYSKDNKGEANPFLLTEEEMRQAAVRAGLGSEGREHELPSNKSKFGEGVVDDDLPNEAEWEAMGDRKTI